MYNDGLIQKTSEYVKQKFATEGTGHDWWHIQRVWKLSKRIAKKEKNCNMQIIELAALLHDIADFKFHGGDHEVGPKTARKWLKSIKAPEDIILDVEDIVRNISFRGPAVKNNLKTIEGQIVHDADKLDAIGAIGIARAFAYSGAVGMLIFDPEVGPAMNAKPGENLIRTSSAVNHFHEKLLLLKNRMYTETGKKMAARRHDFMETYLKEFNAEWEGKH